MNLFLQWEIISHECLAIHLNEGLEISNLMYQDIRCVEGHDSLQELQIRIL